MSSIQIHLRSGKDVAVSDSEPYDEATVQQVLATQTTWPVTRTDGSRLVIPVASVEYVVFAPAKPAVTVIPPSTNGALSGSRA